MSDLVTGLIAGLKSAGFRGDTLRRIVAGVLWRHYQRYESTVGYLGLE